jgi:hypothetical protein
MDQHQIDAAQDFANTALEVLETEGSVHAETAIAGVARMAGTFLFRSFGFNLSGIQPGNVVLSDIANEQGPVLIEILTAALSHLGIILDEEKLGGINSEENRPNKGFLETQRILEPEFSALKERYGLSENEAAETAAFATALLIQEYRNFVDPNTAFDIAIYGFIEGTKTAPDPVSK